MQNSSSSISSNTSNSHSRKNDNNDNYNNSNHGYNAEQHLISDSDNAAIHQSFLSDHLVVNSNNNNNTTSENSENKKISFIDSISKEIVDECVSDNLILVDDRSTIKTTPSATNSAINVNNNFNNNLNSCNSISDINNSSLNYNNSGNSNKRKMNSSNTITTIASTSTTMTTPTTKTTTPTAAAVYNSNNNTNKNHKDQEPPSSVVNSVVVKKNKGGFLSRFTGFRFSLRGKKKLSVYDNNNKSEQKNNDVNKSNEINRQIRTQKSANNEEKSNNKISKQSNTTTNNNSSSSTTSSNKDFIYIPLKEPLPMQGSKQQQDATITNNIDATVFKDNHVLTKKPPLPRQPPRVVGVCAKPNQDASGSTTGRYIHAQRASSAPREIDVTDYNNTSISSSSSSGGYNRQYRQLLDPCDDDNHQFRSNMLTKRYRDTGDGRDGDENSCTENTCQIGLIETNLDTHETIITGKTRSLMELGPQSIGGAHTNYARNQSIVTNRIGGGAAIIEPRRPHKSMEFLLDKENQKNVLVSTQY